MAQTLTGSLMDEHTDNVLPALAGEDDRWISEEEAGDIHTGLGYRRLQNRRLYGGSKPTHYDTRPGIKYRLSDCIAWRDAGLVPGTPATTTTPRPAPSDG